MNRVMWFDIPSDDIDGAARFYGELFGWNVLPRDPQDAHSALGFRPAVTSASNDQLEPEVPGAINGGLVTRDIGITQPTILIEVDDILAKIEAVKAAGGSLVREKTHLPLAGGYFAYVTDPEGNVIGLWEVSQ